MLEIAKSFKFEASHIIPNHPGKCSSLHGHSWELIVSVEGSINPETGMVMDYAELKEKVQPIVDELDHSHLGAYNETPKVLIDPNGTRAPQFRPFPFSLPTSENILIAIGIQLKKRGLLFSRIMLKETESTACCIDYDDFRSLLGMFPEKVPWVKNVTEL